jgi:hypothetical protein
MIFATNNLRKSYQLYANWHNERPGIKINFGQTWQLPPNTNFLAHPSVFHEEEWHCHAAFMHGNCSARSRNSSKFFRMILFSDSELCFPSFTLIQLLLLTLPNGFWHRCSPTDGWLFQTSFVCSISKLGIKACWPCICVSNYQRRIPGVLSSDPEQEIRNVIYVCRAIPGLCMHVRLLTQLTHSAVKFIERYRSTCNIFPSKKRATSN